MTNLFITFKSLFETLTLMDEFVNALHSKTNLSQLYKFRNKNNYLVKI